MSATATATATRHARVTIKRSTVQVTTCESLSEYIDTTDTAALETHLKENNSVKWIGRDLKRDARRKAIQRHDETMQAIDDARDEVRDVTLPQPVTRSRRVRFDEFDGDDICLDRLRDGLPFWRTSQRQQTAGPQNVVVAIDQAASCSTPSHAIAWRGVAGILLAETLESAGIRVELWSVSWSTGTYTDSEDRMVAIKLKSADAPLDSIALGNALSGWFFRSFILHAFRNSPFGSEPDFGLGSPTVPTCETLFDATGIQFDAVVAETFGKSRCIELLERLLRKFGQCDA